MNPTKIIFLTRHGATEYNDKDLLQGAIDLPLSETGQKQAELLSQRLKNETLDIIFHSPLRRAQQTAEIVNKNHHVKLKAIPSFTEMKMGEWEGQNFFDFIKKNPDSYQKWLFDPASQIPGGESLIQLFARINEGVEEIKASKYKKILVVAHAMVNRAVLGNLLEMDIVNARRFRTKNCSLSQLSINQTEKGPYISIDTWNSTDHLNI